MGSTGWVISLRYVLVHLAVDGIQWLAHVITVWTGGIWLTVGYSDWLMLSRYALEEFGLQRIKWLAHVIKEWTGGIWLTMDTVTGSCYHGMDWRNLAHNGYSDWLMLSRYGLEEFCSQWIQWLAHVFTELAWRILFTTGSSGWLVFSGNGLDVFGHNVIQRLTWTGYIWPSIESQWLNHIFTELTWH